jgi:flagellar biosynthesis protein FliR
VQIQLATGGFFVFLFAMVRASAWLAFVPPFASGFVPLIVRTGLAAALALAVTSQLGGANSALGNKLSALGPGAFVTGIVVQAVIGALLGFMTSLLLSAISSAGGIIDMTSGLAASTALDPLSTTADPVTARTYNLLMTTLVFATGGDLLIVKGFLTSFQAAGLSARSAHLIGPALVSEIGFFFLSAVEIAAPVLGCMFLAYVALGLLTRSAPQLNVMSLGFGVNIALALVVAAASLPLLPGAVSTLVERAVTDTLGLLGIKA